VGNKSNLKTQWKASPIDWIMQKKRISGIEDKIENYIQITINKKETSMNKSFKNSRTQQRD
jgi:hypothetical protein